MEQTMARHHIVAHFQCKERRLFPSGIKFGLWVNLLSVARSLKVLNRRKGGSSKSWNVTLKPVFIKSYDSWGREESTNCKKKKIWSLNDINLLVSKAAASTSRTVLAQGQTVSCDQNTIWNTVMLKMEHLFKEIYASLRMTK